MFRLSLLVVVVLLVSGHVLAQTPSVDEYVLATLVGGQTGAFGYTATADDVHIANLLTALNVSAWAMFLFGLFMYLRRPDK